MLYCPADDVSVYMNMANLRNKYNAVNIFSQSPLFTTCEILDYLCFVMRLGDSSIII